MSPEHSSIPGAHPPPLPWALLPPGSGLHLLMAVHVCEHPIHSFLDVVPLLEDFIDDGHGDSMVVLLDSLHRVFGVVLGLPAPVTDHLPRLVGVLASSVQVSSEVSGEVSGDVGDEVRVGGVLAIVRAPVVHPGPADPHDVEAFLDCRDELAAQGVDFIDLVVADGQFVRSTAIPLDPDLEMW